jgi:2-octaprenyl-6-methoxyphenol hydroxylase
MASASAATPIAIVGGGPIGLTCALLAARRGFASIVLDARGLEDARRDRRLLALSRGTWDVLQPILGDAVPAHADISDVYVSSAGEFGSTHIGAADFDGAPLGATVFYGDLVAALASVASENALIEVQRPRQVIRIAQKPNEVVIECDQGTIAAPFVVNAEGLAAADSATQAPRAASPLHGAALTAEIELSGPARGAAYERFTREGPLALLPVPAGSSARDSRPLSLIWCMDEAQAARRAALDDAAFMRELQRQLGSRIGTVMRCGARRTHALLQQTRETVREHRQVFLGNAAQTLHPVAGQGFNLGVRDCLSLVDCLAAHANDIGAALAEHERKRSADRAAVTTMTRWLPDLFASRFAPLAAARSLGLTALDLLPPLRRQWAHLLMFGVRS